MNLGFTFNSLITLAFLILSFSSHVPWAMFLTKGEKLLFFGLEFIHITVGRWKWTLGLLSAASWLLLPILCSLVLTFHQWCFWQMRKNCCFQGWNLPNIYCWLVFFLQLEVIFSFSSLHQVASCLWRLKREDAVYPDALAANVTCQISEQTMMFFVLVVNCFDYPSYKLRKGTSLRLLHYN